ncbi:mitochondrial carrier domain-containing protein [Xylaria bambusicola]|uniref:mitochondrial carrier domain-containing protein n=1 Tax=Xylaria bambusicola TaxID=326684 RepID=UPI0020082AC6|nr:mitochondrial carrier domain-containing protein [Xylaria bambusicola]KAI0508558.1 mitochondrial carrier domain-containing protein [Xylaria bambusicola]
MPSALTNYGSVAEMQREGGNPDSLVGKVDGAIRRASTVISTATDKDSSSSKTSSSSSPTAAAAESATEERAMTEATAGQDKKKPNKHSMDYIMRSFVAGGLAGCAAKTTVAPLDRVKILFQTSNPQFAKYTGSWTGLGRALGDIYAQHGVVGLFRGHSATLLKIYPYAAIKFVAYEQYRALIIGGSKHNETWLRRFSAGALAGLTSVLFTYPLEVIRVRLAFETGVRSSSLLHICKKIYHEHPLPPSSTTTASASTSSIAAATATTISAVAPRSGIINFYRGFSTTMLGMIPYAGMSFLTHDTVGDVFRSAALRKHATLPQPANAPKDKPAPLTAWAELAAGGISGAVSQTISYPLEVVRRRMQVAGAIGDGHRLRIAETAGLIFRERGLPGFFVGLTIGYVKIIPLAAVSFYTYERMKTVLGI